LNLLDLSVGALEADYSSFSPRTPSAHSSGGVMYEMGGNWYIINYYVPVIGVIHVMI